MEFTQMDVTHNVHGFDRVRGLFCDGCSKATSLIPCTHIGCHIGLCCGDANRTGCLNLSDIEGKSWFCPRHNVPLKIKYDINNIGRVGFLHSGRTLVPLLHLVIIPGEVNFQTINAPHDYITPHLYNFYRQHSKPLLCKAMVCGPNAHSIKSFRTAIVEWMSGHVNSAILISLTAHSTVSTGEIVYALPGATENKYTKVDQILKVFLGPEAYNMAIEQNAGMKGIISTACGYTFSLSASLNSWTELVDSNHFDWVVGFGANTLMPRMVRLCLQQFAEYAFLREVDLHGHLLGTQIDHLTDAVERTFGGRDLLAHTSVVLMHSPSRLQPALRLEFVLSTVYKPWGYKLPSCPTCGNGAVNAPIRCGVATATCLACRRTTDGPGVTCPAGVVPSHNFHDVDDCGDRYYWRPLNSVSPWQTHRWAQI